jgi:hypothetical protein
MEKISESEIKQLATVVHTVYLPDLRKKIADSSSGLIKEMLEARHKELQNIVDRVLNVN